MANELVPFSGSQTAGIGFQNLPILVTEAGPEASHLLVEFFTATIRNKNTRLAYARAINHFFDWHDEKFPGVDLQFIQPILVAAYVEELSHQQSAPTVKQHLAAIRMLFDWFVTG